MPVLVYSLQNMIHKEIAEKATKAYYVQIVNLSLVDRVHLIAKDVLIKHQILLR
jgi:hypothetical protein